MHDLERRLFKFVAILMFSSKAAFAVISIPAPETIELDTDFANNGFLKLPQTPRAPVGFTATLLSDGSFLGVSEIRSSNNGGSTTAIRKFDASGHVVNSFGIGGALINHPSISDELYGGVRYGSRISASDGGGFSIVANRSGANVTYCQAFDSIGKEVSAEELLPIPYTFGDSIFPIRGGGFIVAESFSARNAYRILPNCRLDPAYANAGTLSLSTPAQTSGRLTVHPDGEISVFASGLPQTAVTLQRYSAQGYLLSSKELSVPDGFWRVVPGASNFHEIYIVGGNKGAVLLFRRDGSTFSVRVRSDAPLEEIVPVAPNRCATDYGLLLIPFRNQDGFFCIAPAASPNTRSVRIGRISSLEGSWSSNEAPFPPGLENNFDFRFSVDDAAGNLLLVAGFDIPLVDGIANFKNLNPTQPPTTKVGSVWRVGFDGRTDSSFGNGGVLIPIETNLSPLAPYAIAFDSRNTLYTYATTAFTSPGASRAHFISAFSSDGRPVTWFNGESNAVFFGNDIDEQNLTLVSGTSAAFLTHSSLQGTCRGEIVGVCPGGVTNAIVEVRSNGITNQYRGPNPYSSLPMSFAANPAGAQARVDVELRNDDRAFITISSLDLSGETTKKRIYDAGLMSYLLSPTIVADGNGWIVVWRGDNYSPYRDGYYWLRLDGNLNFDMDGATRATFIQTSFFDFLGNSNRLTLTKLTDGNFLVQETDFGGARVPTAFGDCC
jgi:hypothetical protein